MRYHFKMPIQYTNYYGKTYVINHPVYNKATLYLILDKGLCVIQQRYLKSKKMTYWTEVDECLTDIIYLNPLFKEFFNKRAAICVNGLYPTVTVRQIMWALKMKPLKKQDWETVFDRRFV